MLTLGANGTRKCGHPHGTQRDGRFFRELKKRKRIIINLVGKLKYLRDMIKWIPDEPPNVARNPRKSSAYPFS